MPSSLLTQATRAFVKVLLTLAQVYELALTVNRDSSEKDLLKAYRRVALKAHPDKGGSNKDFKTLQAAREKWEALRTTKTERPAGRRWGQAGTEATVASVVGSGSAPESYRVRGCSVLLTYHGFSDLASWREFLDFVEASLEKWGVEHWCATLERSTSGKLHTHLVLQFRAVPAVGYHGGDAPWKQTLVITSRVGLWLSPRGLVFGYHLEAWSLAITSGLGLWLSPRGLVFAHHLEPWPLAITSGLGLRLSPRGLVSLNSSA